MKEKLLAKIQKLLALAECQTGNINETSSAAAMAQKLMLESNISEAEVQGFTLDPEDALVNEYFLGTQKYIHTWQSLLFARVADANNCKAVRKRLYRKSKLKLYGFKSDIDNARYIFEYCMGEIERVCNFWALRTGNTGKSEKTAFKVGAASAVGSSLMAAKRSVEKELLNNSQALVWVNTKANKVEDYFSQNVGHLGKGKAVSVKDHSAYAAGHTEGSKINVGAAGKQLGAKKQLKEGW